MNTICTKYPRTPHLPWSEGIGHDDKSILDCSKFVGRKVVVTEKMDGENTTMYPDYIHARSIDGRQHPSRNWVKNYWNNIRYKIPSGYRVCGENLYAKHSIEYGNLPSYFMGFSVWHHSNVHSNICLSWKDTIDIFEVLGIIPVPIIYEGSFDEKLIKGLWNNSSKNSSEGYVIRITDSFEYSEFGNNVAKFVRKNHVQTDEHWQHASVVPNKLMVV